MLALAILVSLPISGKIRNEVQRFGNDVQREMLAIGSFITLFSDRSIGSKGEEKISNLVNEVQKEYFPDLKQKFIIEEAHIRDYNSYSPLMNTNGYSIRFDPAILYLPKEAVKRCIGHELGHNVLGHCEPSIKTRILYYLSNSVRRDMENAATEEAIRRGRGDYRKVDYLYFFEHIYLKDALK